MAARPIHQDKKDAILIDWRLGILSMRHIADKHKVSKSAVGDLCKGVERDAKATVDDGVQYKQGLMIHGGRMADAIEETVDDIIKFEKVNNSRMELVAKKAISMLDTAERAGDVASVMGVLKTHREARMGKAPDVAVQVNNNVVQHIPDDPLAASMAYQRLISGG